MRPLALDTEGPKFSKTEPWKGTPYGDSRTIVCFSTASYGRPGEATKWSDMQRQSLQEKVDSHLVVFFNGKYDVAALRKVGIDFSRAKCWDVQLGEFILSHQQSKFPSLDGTLERYGFPLKLDVVKTEYWDKGIDTDAIPWPVLSEYAAYDAEATLNTYLAQIVKMTSHQKRLCSLMSQDMLILQEMEQNGLLFDEDLCAKRAEELEAEADVIRSELNGFYPSLSINFGSGDQLSAFLYGGTIYEDSKEHVGFFKTGARKGEPKYKNIVIEHQLPRLFTPLKGTELQKPGYWETNEGVLRKLKGKKTLIEKFLRLAKIEKLNGTYYKGLPKLCAEMHWPKGRLHGQLNQTLAATGRISASKPNQQNFASELQDIFVSQYE